MDTLIAINNNGRMEKTVFNNRRALLILVSLLSVCQWMMFQYEPTFKKKSNGNSTQHLQFANQELPPKYPNITTGVHLVYDKAWFQKESEAGCCPFAEKLYNQRYGHMYNRCCTNRIDEIEPWRPVGGANWEMLMKKGSLRNNATLTIQGDSLAEQHFIAMLCHAWSSEGVEVTNLKNHAEGRELVQGFLWEARIEPIGVTISFLRWDTPKLMPNYNYSKPTFLFVGGWHHGDASEKRMNSFLDQLERLRGESATIVVQALPNHFPGGSYLRGVEYPETKVGLWSNSSNNAFSTSDSPTGVEYPKTEVDLWSNSSNDTASTSYSLAGDQVCDTFALNSGDPDINDGMEQWMKNRSHTMQILNVQHLYRYRGDAHIGKIPPGTVGPTGRDCLHWCVAPGVLDALAIESLSAIHRLR